MKRSLWSLWVLASGLLGVVLWQGCGDPLVGLECAKGYVICDGRCVDLNSDEFSCGSCGSVCAINELCIAAECTTDFDSGRPGGMPGGDEGGTFDGGDAGDGGTRGDAGLDGGGGGVRDGGDAASEGWPDVSLPPLCMGPGSPADCVCELGQLVCMADCVNASVDTENCGACGNNCNATPPPSGRFFCIDGSCQLNCDPPLTVCNNIECVDTQTDPLNCGGCGVMCESGLCDLGVCLDRVAGHMIVIGHDMSSALPATRRLAGNAIFLPTRTRNVRVLMFQLGATPGAQAGIATAIAETEAATGRTALRTEATSVAEVSFQLSSADVFVIAAQANATDAELIVEGDMWSRALQTFVARGGVVVLFDGGGANAGTYQIAQEAGLFTATMRVPLTPRTVNIEASGDALSSFVPAVYQAQQQTVGFDTMDTTVVVRDRMTNLPIVIHVAR
jgi:hypothetical protein